VSGRVNRWWVLPATALIGWIALRWRTSDIGRIDYRIYAGAVRSGDNLYHFKFHILGLGFTYPPFAALVFWPLSRFADHTGEQIWMVVNALASIAFLVVVVDCLPRRPRANWYAPICVAAGMFLMPIMLSGRLGQVNALIALAVAVDLQGLRRGWRWAGVGTGVAAAVKLTPAVLVPYYWWAGRRRAAVVAAITGVACEAFAVPFLPGPSSSYWSGGFKETGRVGDLGSGYSNSLRRFVTWTQFPTGLQTLLWLVLVCALALVAYRRAVAADQRGNLLGAFTIVMCFSYLASPITWGHHLWFLPVAVLLVLGEGRDWRRLALSGILLLTVLDFWDGGEGPITSACRVAAMILVVVALPIDEPDGPEVSHGDLVTESVSP
jgi:alpha-1,2-mannosyltransferase